MQEQIEKYLKKCTARGVSLRAISNYRTNLSTFQNWWNDKDLRDLTSDDIDEYIIYLRKLETINPTTLNNKLRDLKAFLRYASEKEWCREINIRLLRVQEPDIIPLETEQLTEIYDACLIGKSLSHVRDYTIMRLLEETGIRLSECMQLLVTDINLNEKRFKLGRHTKNRKAREVYLTPALKKDLNLYLEARQRFMASNGLKSNNLWIVTKNPHLGKPLQARTVQERIKKYGDMAGIPIRVSPHTFRHTFARNFLMAGGDPFTLQELLGHSTLEMVRRYVRLFNKDIQNNYERTMRNHELIKKRKAKKKPKWPII